MVSQDSDKLYQSMSELILCAIESNPREPRAVIGEYEAIFRQVGYAVRLAGLSLRQG